jgi:hypothetical protein
VSSIPLVRIDIVALAMYHARATRLKDAVDLQPEDLLVNVVENTKADRTFGFGRAHFLEGDL